MDHQKLLTNLEQVARTAGDLTRELPRGQGPVVDKGEGDFATQADLLADEYITRTLTQLFPDVPIVSEESYKGGAIPERAFVVDPLDGTLIFSRGAREWGVIIGYLENGQPQAGVIYQPDIGALLKVQRGQGCFLNNKRIQFTPAERIQKLSLALDLGYAVDRTLMIHLVSTLLPEMLLCRTHFSAVGNIFDFLQFRTDAMFNCGGKIWDFLVGALACEEAGGVSTDLDGSALTWKTIPAPGILCASQAVSDKIQKLISPNFPKVDFN